MSESVVRKEKETAQDVVEKEDIAATSYVSGQYSIPNCIRVLRNLKQNGYLHGNRFSYALELIKDSKNRVIVVSLKDYFSELEDWIDYKFNK